MKVIIFILYTQKSIIFALLNYLRFTEIRKDLLYCGDPNSLERRGCRTALDILFNHLTAWLAPILCTAEEAWQCYINDKENSIHLKTIPTQNSGMMTLNIKWKE